MVGTHRVIISCGLRYSVGVSGSQKGWKGDNFRVMDRVLIFRFDITAIHQYLSGQVCRRASTCTMDWFQAVHFAYLLPLSRATRASRKMLWSPQLIHKGPVMRAMPNWSLLIAFTLRENYI